METALCTYAALVTLAGVDDINVVFSTKVIPGASFFVAGVVTKPLRRRIARFVCDVHLTAVGRIN
ncbi:hypothetical protein L1D15_18420 [Vibrio sp. Isolate25]|uniref:hypothetical protein n=1 Tax=Vibrio TaxID=662 RepID=UPI001EFDE52C|nr:MULTISPECIES: hypothetical protein [Vibrio]MCG9598691.1 hypothetical protein [Vibrio sp. Isolate25]MCG9680448.1 hypothetical protein [Vibrio sp. Isolate24]MCG9684901.1 hypothetical protein [Vibrio sp. Isolate23]USD34120.1 hypothetical protein J8Z27_00230 [Vibrio sp. SCSIO 43186]USD47194.1 hypothetical protein J4N38_00230 [Vibrio sp. SCSIO 43145]